MPVTVDKLLGKVLLHAHKEADISDLDKFALTQDTRANILATTPTTDVLAFATDSHEFFLYDTTNSTWRIAPLELESESSGIDMGAYTASGLGVSDRAGYYKDAITDKTLHNIVLKGSSRTVVGGLRIDTTQDPDTFEIYLGDAWQTILYDLTVEDNEFEHTPLSEEIDVWSGNSNLLGLNGVPIIQEYKVSMGAYPAPRIISGGTF